MIEEQVNLLVREILGRAEEIATSAVREAFATKRDVKVGPRRALGGSGARRRNGAEVAQLGDRLYAEVSAQPGMLMSVLAERVGVPAKELNLPARRLKAEGRIKTTGARSTTRYFPSGKAKS